MGGASGQNIAKIYFIIPHFRNLLTGQTAQHIFVNDGSKESKDTYSCKDMPLWVSLILLPM